MVNDATSSVKSLLIEMGFDSIAVENAIAQNGVDDFESLVDILTKSIVAQRPEPKQEPDVQYDANDPRMMLLSMKFPQTLVDLALSRLGKDAPIDEMVDFITAAQLAETYAQESGNLPDGAETNRGDEPVVPATEVPNELPFEEMDKTLQLLKMGFSHHEISRAIEKKGTQAQISELAGSIMAGDREDIEKKACPSKNWRFVGVGDEGSSSGTTNLGDNSMGKRIKDEGETDFDDRRKRLRPGYMGGSRSVMETPGMHDESKGNPYEVPSAMQPRCYEVPSPMQPRLSQKLPSNAAKRPYFLYGSIGELSPGSWSKISSFFFDIHPEHVDTRLCSALSRKEGYIHNLPMENRFSIVPKPNRIAPTNTSPIEPENLEDMMGYPVNHTNVGRLAERLKLLQYCFQTDTLGYHLSVLKSMFPQGLTVLSLFSGIGGAEIALSRLGIHLKCVVSVESSGLSRKILKRWWQTSGQTGELVQFEDISTVRTRQLEPVIKKFGGIDLVICQNPATPPDLSKERSQAGEFDIILLFEVERVANRVRNMMKSK